MRTAGRRKNRDGGLVCFRNRQGGIGTERTTGGVGDENGIISRIGGQQVGTRVSVCCRTSDVCAVEQPLITQRHIALRGGSEYDTASLEISLTLRLKDN